ncbi:ski oncogene-like [Condylostylus longicornis]|uniref:ski oncogene-like n=1 Tax=Condylostylus longicornis TaxID=2530218 RepID=UPI00244E4F48|nr:ski oncogene-like [Condylostylus longicornis]
MTEFVTPHLRTVLKTYQNSATKSLQGPGQSLPSVATQHHLSTHHLNNHLTATVTTGSATVLAIPSQNNHLNNNNNSNTNNCNLLINNNNNGSNSNNINLNHNGSNTKNNTNILSTSSTASSSSASILSSINTTSGITIKKEILSSPEPLDCNDTSDNMMHNVIVQPPLPPEIPQPILTAPDTGCGELLHTELEGKPIGCFLLGGEMRLCLPQFLNNVLTDFTLDQINHIFDDLRIFCSQCSPDQLMKFKGAKILPDDVKASGLITRTDAERLCAALLHRSDIGRCNIDIPKGATSFKVYHRCFGKCEGICIPDLYSFQKPSCIRCCECKGLFSPQKFVGHVHRLHENRTCHWGFDSRNWRDYLHVALDEDNRDKYTKMLDDLKEIEQQEIMNAELQMAAIKRKVCERICNKYGN